MRQKSQSAIKIMPWSWPDDPRTGQKDIYKTKQGGFPGGAVVKNLPANAGDTGWSPGPGRSHMP